MNYPLCIIFAFVQNCILRGFFSKEFFSRVYMGSTGNKKVRQRGLRDSGEGDSGGWGGGVGGWSNKSFIPILQQQPQI